MLESFLGFLHIVDMGSVPDVIEIRIASETSMTLLISTWCKDPREESKLTVSCCERINSVNILDL
jgi:hypothetical protein